MANATEAFKLGMERWQRGMALLARGDYAAGFAEVERAWLGARPNHKIFEHYGIPPWQGEDISDRSILLVHEWGLGDSIMFLRYVPLVKANYVAAAVPKSLAPLVAIDVFNDKVPPEFFDFYAPIPSLPRYFPIPAPPYIKAEPNGWRGRIGGDRRMGIAWSGNPKHDRDATRSIALSAFLEWLPHDGYTLYSLQNTQQELARAHGVISFEYADFSEVAAVAALMDVIVTVDTAAANLVGAMAHANAHVMLDYAHDWRWYRGDEWYPTLKRHRQKQLGDWPSAFAELEF